MNEIYLLKYHYLFRGNSIKWKVEKSDDVLNIIY